MTLFKTNSFWLLFLLLFASSCAHQLSDTTDSREVKNLIAFSKLYGYVRYFHPSDEAREVDWNRLAVLGVERVKNVKTDEELKQALEALFEPIAPTVKISKTKPSADAFLPKYVEWIGGDTTGLTTVAWQHLGVDMNNKNHVYASSRTNREDSRDSRFVLFQNVNTQDLPKSTVRLRATIKAAFEGPASEGVLVLRLNDGNIRPLHTVTKTVRPTASDPWKTYTVQTTLDSSASQLTIGAMLKRDGKLWIADFQLEVKGKEGRWSPVSLQNAKFKHQHKDRPLGWEITGMGHYDYGVASDEAVDGNSFYMVGKDLLFRRYPRVGETTVRQLTAGLWCEVPLALYSDEDHTLPRSSRPDLRRLKTELGTIDLTRHATGYHENVGLADIVVAWNVFQHFYPYFEVVYADWQAELSKALKRALTDDTQQEFTATLSRMLAATGDGHIRLRHPSIANEAGLPFLVDWIEGKVVVTHSLHERIQPGDIVVSVDGQPARDLVQDQIKHIPGSAQLALFRSLRQLGAGESGTEAVVEIRRNGEVSTFTVPRSSRRSNSIIEKNHLPVTGRIRDGIYYVDLDRAPMARINSEMDQIASSRAVIFDLRGYPNGNHQVIRHLLIRQDTSDQWMQIPKIIYPDQQNFVGYQEHGWHLPPAKPHIRGEVVFITDARAISYAESFMSFIEHYNLGEIVGQPTAGTNGNVNLMVLPGGYQFGWTGMKVIKHDGSQHHLIGIQPTVPVEKTIQGIREGKDELLEKAIEILK